MRYDTPVFFQKIIPGEYDTATGNYGNDTVVETKKHASVMDTGANMLVFVYGSIRQGSLTVQLQNHYKMPFDRIRVGNKVYKVDFSRSLRTKQIFVVSEAQ